MPRISSMLMLIADDRIEGRFTSSQSFPEMAVEQLQMNDP
jgi:hypothetical protein